MRAGAQPVSRKHLQKNSFNKVKSGISSTFNSLFVVDIMKSCSLWAGRLGFGGSVWGGLLAIAVLHPSVAQAQAAQTVELDRNGAVRAIPFERTQSTIYSQTEFYGGPPAVIVYPATPIPYNAGRYDDRRDADRRYDDRRYDDRRHDDLRDGDRQSDDRGYRRWDGDRNAIVVYPSVITPQVIYRGNVQFGAPTGGQRPDWRRPQRTSVQYLWPVPNQITFPTSQPHRRW